MAPPCQIGLKLLHLYQLELNKVWQEMIGTQVGNCNFSLLFKMERALEYCQKGLVKQNLNIEEYFENS